MQKIVDYVKQYIGVISIVLAVCILLTYSLSNFKINIESKKAAEMYIGELKYTMTIDGKSTNTLTVPAGESIVDINLTNQNEIKTYYKILYSNNDNISISYYDQTKNTNDEITSYKAPSDSIENKSSNNIKLKIINNSTSNQSITFKVSGGYSTNTLQDVEVPNTYTEITTLETPSNNTYFCETNNDITIGTEYVNGQYTYRYMQEGIYSSDGLAWKGIATDGWGVQLTDKTSTEPVTSKLCTYINNKPITSMSQMFYGSSATTLDLSSFDTSNVTNMSNMFRGSPAKTLALSNFNTSNVTDMSQMFNGSAATTLDLSSFNTSNVTDMNQMFFNSAATTLDLSSFNTSKVTDMSY
ncbi:MAG: BspA family leucine-rich repeat surface protein, partial [Bacilli bacterium]